MSNSILSNSNPPMRAALYIRVSSEEQAKEGYSLIAQQEKLEDYVQKNGHLLNKDNIYIDDGYSGKTENRPALFRLFDDAKKKIFDVVLVYRLDRFFRNVRLLLESVESLGNCVVGLKSITEPFDTSTPIGRYVLINLGAIAELERAIIMERKELGTLKAAQAGKWMGGAPPYGYRLNRETKKLEIEPKEAKVVKMFYDWLTKEKTTLFQIQKRANALKIPTKHDLLGKEKPTSSKGWWRKQTIARMFSNEIYAGTFWFRKYKNPSRSKSLENLRPKEEWVAISVPAIISKAQFEQARKQIEENRKLSPRRTMRTYLFAKRIYCGLCGKSMIAQYRAPYRRRKTGVKLYTCHKRFKEHAPILCSQKSMVEPRIEIPVWEAIKKLLMQPEAMLKELEAYQRREDPRPSLELKQAEIDKQLTELGLKQERLLDLYIEGAIDKAAFLERTRKLEWEKEKSAKKSSEISQALISEEERAFKIASIRQLYEQLGINLEDGDYETKRLVIELLVRRIVVNSDRLDVECHIPDRFLDKTKNFQVALSRNGRVDCDSKHIISFSVNPYPANGLRRKPPRSDEKPKLRSDKPKATYEETFNKLEWHLGKIKAPLTLQQFQKARELILVSGAFQEEYKKRHIVYVDHELYNRFILSANRWHFWLGVRGRGFHEKRIHSYLDKTHTFFKITSHVPMERVEEVILKHARLSPKSLSEIRREQNLKYGLKRNLFYPDGRLKARLGGKPKGCHTLEWHTKILQDLIALKRFLKVRNIILSTGLYQEEFRKCYITYIDKALYNRFMLLPEKRHFWLAIKGKDLQEEGLNHQYCDGIQTFFKISSDVSLERLNKIIQKHTAIGGY